MKNYINKLESIKNKKSKFPHKEIDYVLDVLDNSGINYINKLDLKHY